MTRYIPTIALLCALTGCGAGQSALVAAGVSQQTAQTIAVDTAEAGQLFCQYGPTVAAVAGVKVNNATAAAVAAACSAIQVATNGVTAVPVPPPASGSVPVVTVPGPVAAAVAASVPAQRQALNNVRQ